MNSLAISISIVGAAYSKLTDKEKARLVPAAAVEGCAIYCCSKIIADIQAKYSAFGDCVLIAVEEFLVNMFTYALRRCYGTPGGFVGFIWWVYSRRKNDIIKLLMRTGVSVSDEILSNEPIKGTLSPEDESASGDAVKWLRQRLQEVLTEDEQRLADLLEHEDMSNETRGSILNWPEAKVRRKVHQLRRKLRQYLPEFFDEIGCGKLF